MIDAALIPRAEMLLALLIVKAPRRVELPTAALKVMFPVPAVKVKSPGPSNELTKRISPAPAPVLRVVNPINVVTGPVNWIF